MGKSREIKCSPLFFGRFFNELSAPVDDQRRSDTRASADITSGRPVCAGIDRFDIRTRSTKVRIQPPVAASSSDTILDSLLYLHWVKIPFFADFDSPERYGYARQSSRIARGFMKRSWTMFQPEKYAISTWKLSTEVISSLSGDDTLSLVRRSVSRS